MWDSLKNVLQVMVPKFTKIFAIYCQKFLKTATLSNFTDFRSNRNRTFLSQSLNLKNDGNMTRFCESFMNPMKVTSR